MNHYKCIHEDVMLVFFLKADAKMAASLLGELSCAVCLETYTDPVTLPCMHSFCRECLGAITKSNITEEHLCSPHHQTTNRIHNERVIDCPECRYIAVLDERGINGLPKNFTLAKLVERCLSNKSQELQKPKVPCNVCDAEPPRNAVKFCIQCNFSYCAECIPQLHPSRGALASHSLVEVHVPVDTRNERQQHKASEIPPLSQDHSDNVFCLSCNKIIITTMSHSMLGHQTIDVNEAKLQKKVGFYKVVVD